jgi:hypothetical protein
LLRILRVIAATHDRNLARWSHGHHPLWHAKCASVGHPQWSTSLVVHVFRFTDVVRWQRRR